MGKDLIAMMESCAIAPNAEYWMHFLEKMSTQREAWRRSRRYCDWHCLCEKLSTTLWLLLSFSEIVNNIVIVIVILRDCQHQRKPADLKTTSSIMGSHHQWSLKSGTNSKQRQHGLDKENSPAQFSFPFTFKNFSDPSTSQTRFFLSFSHQSWRLRVSFSLRESRRPSPRSRNLCFVCHPL